MNRIPWNNTTDTSRATSIASFTIAKHSETLEDMVVYQAMYGERGIWVRPKSMFEEVIERDGQTFRRFVPITAEEAQKSLQ